MRALFDQFCELAQPGMPVCVYARAAYVCVRVCMCWFLVLCVCLLCVCWVCCVCCARVLLVSVVSIKLPRVV